MNSVKKVFQDKDQSAMICAFCKNADDPSDICGQLYKDEAKNLAAHKKCMVSTKII